MLQKRKFCVTVFEILLPILFAVVMVVIRMQSETTTETSPTTWKPFPVEMDVQTALGVNRVLFTPNSSLAQTIMSKVEATLGLTGKHSDFNFLYTVYNAV